MNTIFYGQRVALEGALVNFTDEDMGFALRSLSAQLQPIADASTGIIIVGDGLGDDWRSLNEQYPNARLIFEFELDEHITEVEYVDDWFELVEYARDHYRSLH